MKPYVKLSLFMILVVGVAYSASLILRGDIEKLPVSTWQEGTEDRLITIPVQTSGASPFIDANETVEIESREKSIIFYSKNGERVYNPATNTWSVTISPNKYQGKAEKAQMPRDVELNANQLTILGWYGSRHMYSNRKIIGNMNYFLFSYSAENGHPYCDVLVNAVGKKAWEIPFRVSYCLHINPPFAWMGDGQGIVRMDLKTNRLTRFVLLPTFNGNIQWCDFQGKRYIISHEKFIQVLDLQSGNISTLDLPVEIKNRFHICPFDPCYNYYDYIYDYGSTFFSKPVIRDGSLYTSIKDTGFLLKYHLASGKLRFNFIGKNSPVNELVEIKDIVWLITALVDSDEGIDNTYYGNIAFMDKNETIHYFPQFEARKEAVDRGEDMIPETYGVAPIRAYFSDADNIYFLSMGSDYSNYDGTYSPEGTIIKLSGPNWQTVTMEPLCNSNRHPDRYKKEYQIRESNLKLYKQFIPVSSGLTYEIESQMQSWKVRYAMVEIPYGKAKSVDYTKENKRSLNQEEEPGD